MAKNDRPAGDTQEQAPEQDSTPAAQPEQGGFRIWSPLELARGALAEHPPTTEGWTDEAGPDEEPTA